MSILVITIGNPSRGDDAVGPWLHQFLLQWLTQQPEPSLPVELMETFQLQIEDSMDLHHKSQILFIDCGIKTPEPYSFYRIQANADRRMLFSHALHPESLLSVYQSHYQQPPPPAYVFCVAGYQFGLGADISSHCQRNLTASIPELQALLSNPDPDYWQQQADCDQAALSKENRL